MFDKVSRLEPGRLKLDVGRSWLGNSESPLTTSHTESSESPLTTSCMGSSESTRHGSSRGELIMCLLCTLLIGLESLQIHLARASTRSFQRLLVVDHGFGRPDFEG